MHIFDLSLKDLLMDGAPALMEQIAGVRSVVPLPVELPAVTGGRLDLLAAINGNALLHTEIQASNDPLMAIRMLGYHRLILRQMPAAEVRQIVLYVGGAPMDMPRFLEGPMLRFRLDLVDARTIPAAPLLASEAPSDIVMALFAATDDIAARLKEVVGRLVERLGSEPDRLRDVLVSLSLLTPLRNISNTLMEEITAMPIPIDLETHPFASRFFLRGKSEGREEGRAEGRKEGRAEGETAIFLRLLEKRFGPPSAELFKRIQRAAPVEVEQWSERLLSADCLDDVFRPSSQS